ncbi:unnamed protein product [Mytilus edulis]|uniref:Uncharacterized protein n=1 Tax=Mytilus edulis TaxID=6550 RepID=A0A8S3R391_MYTED|nr:unnamed protein product [Mytilus edulis]
MKDMSYVLLFINAIVVVLMAMYVYQNERRMRELSTDQELSTLEKEVNVLKLEKKKIEIRKAIQEEKDYISKLQVSEQAADKTPLKVLLPKRYDGTLTYNYDEMAQSYCASLSSGWVFALRRDCARGADTCNNICASAKNLILASVSNQRTRVSCFDAYRVDNPSTAQPDSNTVFLRTHGYGSGGCTWEANHCGPNYCCCKAF